jgi:hypothetical protein
MIDEPGDETSQTKRNVQQLEEEDVQDEKWKLGNIEKV